MDVSNSTHTLRKNRDWERILEYVKWVDVEMFIFDVNSKYFWMDLKFLFWMDKWITWIFLRQHDVRNICFLSSFWFYNLVKWNWRKECWLSHENIVYLFLYIEFREYVFCLFESNNWKSEMRKRMNWKGKFGFLMEFFVINWIFGDAECMDFYFNDFEILWFLKTPLHLAVIYGKRESIEILLQFGADVKMKNVLNFIFLFCFMISYSH